MDIDQSHTNYSKLTTKTSCKQKSKRSKKINFFLLLLTTSRSERPVDQGGNNETALFFLFLSPILLPSLQRHERVVFRTLAGHACPRVLYLPSFSRTFHSSLLVTPLACLCSSHRLFPSITGFALHARTTTHGTHGDAFSHLRSLSSNVLPSRSIKFPPFNSFASTSLSSNCNNSYCIIHSYEFRKLSRNIIL